MDESGTDTDCCDDCRSDVRNSVVVVVVVEVDSDALLEEGSVVAAWEDTCQ